MKTPISMPAQPSEATAAGREFGSMATAAVVLWGLVIAAGSLLASRYEYTPAPPHAVSDRWPSDTACTLSTSRPTLLMFVHPRCPCSRASLYELTVLMTHCRDRVDAQILFLQPQSAPAEWAKTDLWTSATRIPGVEPRLDLAGAEHRRFGACTSGEVLLFMPSGELAFHGGITGHRGHAGDNVGRFALESILLDGHRTTETTPVFGCELNCPTPPASRTIAGHEAKEAP